MVLCFKSMLNSMKSFKIELQCRTEFIMQLKHFVFLVVLCVNDAKNLFSMNVTCILNICVCLLH